MSARYRLAAQRRLEGFRRLTGLQEDFRQLAVICAAPPLGGSATGRTIVLHQRLFFGSMLDVTTDSLLLYYEGDPGTRQDDGWVRARPTSVSAVGACPDGCNSPAYTIVADLALPEDLMLNRAGAIPVGAPVRGFQTITYRLYQATDRDWYLGLQPRGGTVQPLVGPLAGRNGLTLRYFDAANVVTAEPDSVAAIEFTIRGRTSLPVHAGAPGPGLRYVVDSLVARVTLRNNRRF